MSYSEFDINSAINPVVTRKSIKLAGVSEVAKIYNSNSTSTEEFISGAIHNLGVVDRNVMFVNSSLSGLRDRLAIAAKVAKNVNTAKDRGIEGFGSVQKMDPWQYALESGIGSFFENVWKAIRTACSRLINAIANIIKHIQIFIGKADVKRQVKDYKYFQANQNVLKANAKKSGVLSKKFNALNWKLNAKTLPEKVESIAGLYTNAFKGMFTKGDGNALEALTAVDLSQCKTIEGFNAVSKKIFGTFGDLFKTNSFEGGAKSLNSFIEKVNEKIAEPRAAACKKAKVKEDASASLVAKNLMVSGDGKVSQTTVEKMMNLSSDYACLSEDWLNKSVVAHVTDLNAAVKQMTVYTKTVDKVAAKFKKAAVDSVGGAAIKSISTALSNMSNARIRLNSWFTSLMLELELYALRFRKNAHTALRLYINGGTKPKKEAEKKSKENYDTSLLFAL